MANVLRPNYADAFDDWCHICQVDRAIHYRDDKGGVCVNCARQHEGWKPSVRALSYALGTLDLSVSDKQLKVATEAMLTALGEGK